MARSRRPKTAIQSGNLGIPEQSREAGTQTQSRRKRKPTFRKLGTPAESRRLKTATQSGDLRIPAKSAKPRTATQSRKPGKPT